MTVNNNRAETRELATNDRKVVLKVKIASAIGAAIVTADDPMTMLEFQREVISLLSLDPRAEGAFDRQGG